MVVCCRLWSDEDQAEDEFVRQGSLPFIATEVALEVKAQPAGEQQVVTPDDVQVKKIPAVSSTATPPPSENEGSVSAPEDKVAVETDPSKESPPEETPASVETVAEPEAESVKRADDLLTEGGLLLEEILGKDKKIVRRLVLDTEKGVLSWVVKKFFVDSTENIQLSDARIMCTDNLLKIGVGGKKTFITFEASDAEEAAAVCDCLVAHAKITQEEEEAAK